MHYDALMMTVGTRIADTDKKPCLIGVNESTFEGATRWSWSRVRRLRAPRVTTLYKKGGDSQGCHVPVEVGGKAGIASATTHVPVVTSHPVEALALLRYSSSRTAFGWKSGVASIASACLKGAVVR